MNLEVGLISLKLKAFNLTIYNEQYITSSEVSAQRKNQILLLAEKHYFRMLSLKQFYSKTSK